MKLDNIKLDIIKWASGPSIDEKCYRYIHSTFIINYRDNYSKPP